MPTYRPIIAVLLLMPIMAHAQFSFPYHCDEQNREKLCLIDKHAKSQSVVLFSQNSRQQCKAKTVKAFEDSTSALDPFPATRLDTTGCLQSNYDVAYLGKDSPPYSTLTLEQTRDVNIIKSVHVRISRTVKYKELQSDFQDSLSRQPTLYRMPSPKGSAYLVHYTIDRNGMKYGPLFFITDNAIKEVDGEASIVRAMRIGKFTYLLIEHSCWGGCGNVYTALIRFGNGKFSRVAVNGYWAT